MKISAIITINHKGNIVVFFVFSVPNILSLPSSVQRARCTRKVPQKGVKKKKKKLVTPGVKRAGDPTNQGGEVGVLEPILSTNEGIFFKMKTTHA